MLRWRNPIIRRDMLRKITHLIITALKPLELLLLSISVFIKLKIVHFFLPFSFLSLHETHKHRQRRRSRNPVCHGSPIISQRMRMTSRDSHAPHHSRLLVWCGVDRAARLWGHRYTFWGCGNCGLDIWDCLRCGWGGCWGCSGDGIGEQEVRERRAVEFYLTEFGVRLLRVWAKGEFGGLTLGL